MSERLRREFEGADNPSAAQQNKKNNRLQRSYDPMHRKYYTVNITPTPRKDPLHEPFTLTFTLTRNNPIHHPLPLWDHHRQLPERMHLPHPFRTVRGNSTLPLHDLRESASLVRHDSGPKLAGTTRQMPKLQNPHITPISPDRSHKRPPLSLDICGKRVEYNQRCLRPDELSITDPQHHRLAHTGNTSTDQLLSGSPWPCGHSPALQ